MIFVILASLILAPIPILLLCCCRSRYYLIDPKGEQRNPSSDNEDGVDDGDLNDRITDIMIDTTIPIKLLFLVNAHKVEDIKKEYQGKLCYATGEISEVGKKLFELDADIQLELKRQGAKEAKKKIDVKQEEMGSIATLQQLKETHRELNKIDADYTFSNHGSSKALDMSAKVRKYETPNKA